jgi:hypothetical protein
MKYVFGALVLAFSMSQIAKAEAIQTQTFNFDNMDLMWGEPPCSPMEEGCEDRRRRDRERDNYPRTCYAQDAQGHIYKYSLHWVDDAHVQRRAVQKCQQNSRRPETCRPMGCRRIG